MRERSRPACSSTDEAARQGKHHQYSRTNLTIHLSNVDTGGGKPSSKPATANFNQKQASKPNWSRRSLLRAGAFAARGRWKPLFDMESQAT
jgi:hypothetical protein